MIVEEVVARLRVDDQRAGMKMNNLTKRVGQFALGIGAAIASIQTLRKALNYAFDATLYAAKASQIEQAFQNITKQSGTTSAQVMEDLRKMSLGTVSDLKLMQSASRAALFDIPLDKLDEMMHVAMASATATGESVEYMFESIVTGIGRASPMILDNLGLAIRSGEAYQAMANNLGKTTEELTVAERKQALLNDVLRAGAELTEKVGDAALEMTDLNKYEQAQTAFENLRKEIGTFLLPVFRNIADEAGKLATNLADVVRQSNIIKNLGSESYTAKEKVEALTAEMERLSRGTSFGMAGAAQNVQRIKQLEAQRDALLEQMRYEAMAADYMKRGAEEEAKRAKAAAAEAAAEAARAKQIEEYLKLVEDAYGKTAEGQKEALETSIAYWEDQLPYANKTKEQVIAILDMLREELEKLEESGKEPAILKEFERSYEILDKTGLRAKEGIDAATTALIELEHQTGNTTQEIQRMKEEWLETNRELVWAVQDSSRAYDILGKAGEDNLAGIDAATTALIEMEHKHQEEIEKTTELQKKLADIMKQSFQDSFEALGEAIVKGEEGWISFGEVIKDTMAKVLEAIGQEMLVRAAAAAVPGPTFNPVAAIGYTAAAATAFTGAGVVRALEHGGIITEPVIGRGMHSGATYAIGESGPEEIVPLRGGKRERPIIVIQNIHGSVLAQRQLDARARRAVMRMAR